MRKSMSAWERETHEWKRKTRESYIEWTLYLLYTWTYEKQKTKTKQNERDDERDEKEWERKRKCTEPLYMVCLWNLFICRTSEPYMLLLLLLLVMNAIPYIIIMLRKKTWKRASSPRDANEKIIVHCPYEPTHMSTYYVHVYYPY